MEVKTLYNEGVKRHEESEEAKAAGARLRMALDMHDFGVEMLWFALKRENPESSDSGANGLRAEPSES